MASDSNSLQLILMLCGHWVVLGLSLRVNTQCITSPPQTTAFQDISQNGRCQLVAVALPGDVVLVIAQVYGWTGARQDAVAAGRTDDMFSVIFPELQQHPAGN